MEHTIRRKLTGSISDSTRPVISMYYYLLDVIGKHIIIHLFWEASAYSHYKNTLLVANRCAWRLKYKHYTQLFFYKKPRVRGSGSAFLRIPEFESQKFLRSIKIPVFSFIKLSYFEPHIFLKFYTNTTFRTIILGFGQKFSHFVSNVDEIGIQLSNLPYFSLIFS